VIVMDDGHALVPGPWTPEPTGCTCPTVWHGIIPPPCPVHNPGVAGSGWTSGHIELAPPVALGWECPRCHVVHAPSVLRCECVNAAAVIARGRETLAELEPKYADHPPARAGTTEE